MKRSLFIVLACVGWAAAEPVAPYQPQVQQAEVPKAVQLPSVPPPIQITGPSMTLEQAIQVAYRYQTQLRVGESQVGIAAGRARQASAARNPQLGLSSGYQHLLINRNSFPAEFGSAFNPNGWTHSAQLQQLLFDFGYTNNLVRSAEEAKRSAEAALGELRSDLVYTVKQTYYGVIQADRLVTVQEANIVNRRHHIQDARSRFQAGLGLPSDVTRAETALASALFNLSQAQTDAASRRLQLNQALGLDPRVPLTLQDSTEEPVAFAGPEELFTKALERRQELVQYRASVASAQAALDAAHVQNAPTVGTSVAYRNVQNPFQETLTLNLNIQFNVLDGGAKDGKVQETTAALEQAKAQLLGIEQAVLTEVGQAYLNLKNAEQQIKSAEAEEKNAGETVRLQEGRYRVGLGLFIDLIDAQSAYLTAQTNRVNAQTALDLARAALAQVIGEPIPALREL